MSEDKKEFYRRQLSLDGSNLGRAINTLSSIEGRWENLKPEIKWVNEFLRGIKTLLKYGGWEGYSPDHSISIPDLRVELPKRHSSEKLKIAKDLEALPKLQAQRDEKVKTVYDRLEKISKTHQDLIVTITTRRELWVEDILQRELTLKESERMIEYIMEKTKPNWRET